MNGIKEFFSKKAVRVTAWIVLFLSAAALIIGGITTSSISNGVALVSGVITAVSAIITFISSNSSE